MYLDYQKLVCGTYYKRKKENQLPLRLVNLTPAQLREECLDACDRRYLKRDEKMLALFFGNGSNQQEYSNLIYNFKIHKFKSLIIFLDKGKVDGDTAQKNIELLAWLIDLPQRPFEHGKDYVQLLKKLETVSVNQAEDKTNSVPISTSTDFPEPGIPSKPIPPETFPASIAPTAKPLAKRRFNMTKLIVITSIVCLAGVTLLFNFRKNAFGVFDLAYKPQFCMYWAGDHFEKISCNQKKDGVLIIAFDSARFNNFKRITRPDTITYSSIGHLWYSKIDTKVEFYTSNGHHPVQIHYQLHPATAYMIDIYAKKTE